MPKDKLQRRTATRIALAVAGVGAAAAIVALTVFAQSDDAPEAADPDAHTAPVGACLDWASADGKDMRQVPCSAQHRFEITEVVDVSAVYPADADLPSSKKWRDLAARRCAAGAETYLGQRVDPEGKLQVSALRPRESDWSDGARDLRCGLWRVGPGGSAQPLKGPAVEEDQSNVWQPGTCLGLRDKTVGDPVPCAEKHSYEVVAVIDLADRFKKYPSQAKQDEWLATQCAQASKRFTKGKKLPGNLDVTWDRRSSDSWRAGSRKVNCKVGAALDDGSGLAAVTGSVKDATKKPK